jgi:superfamily II DNA/RNA helicase
MRRSALAWLACAASYAPPRRRTVAPLYAQQSDDDTWEALGLLSTTIEAAKALGPEFARPTPVQSSAIASILKDQSDALIHAQTGSGKTLAYLLPLVERVDSTRQNTQACVVVPTRELGMQVAKVLRRLTKGTVMSLLDGSSLKRQRTWAWAEPPHIVVGNPGPLRKMADYGGLKTLDACSFVVVDEVDSFLDDIDRRESLHRLLNDHLPATRTTVFATASIDAPQHMPGDLQRRRWATRQVAYLSSERGMPSIAHSLVICSKPEARLAVVRQFLKGVFEANAETAAVVFLDAKRLSLLPKIAAVLSQDGLKVDVLDEIADLGSRSSAFEAYVKGETDVLLTTDLAARGLDAPRTSLVVNFDVPRTATSYLHRAGRTARLGRRGAVLTVCEQGERFALERFGNKLGVAIGGLEAGAAAYEALAVGQD